MRRFAAAAAVLLVAAAGIGPAAPARASVESELSFHRGVIAYAEGRLDEAVAEFERVLVDEPDDAATHQYLGLIAVEQADFERAIASYRRAVELTPDDPELRLELGSALLEAGRNDEASELLDPLVAADPSLARGQLLAGIASYRLRRYAESAERLEEATRLDPGLSREARYYTGLVYAYLGNVPAASDAFAAVQDQSPLHPLGQSAAELGREMEPYRGGRPWELALTLGTEYDSNPLVVGSLVPREDDVRGVASLRTSFRAIGTERYELSAGYDAYVSLHAEEDAVDVQTHLGWLAGSALVGPVRASLRYDYSYTFLDLTNKFQSVHRVTPRLLWSQSRYTATELGYQFLDFEYYRPNFDPVLDQDGNRHVASAGQFLFPGNWIEFVRVGVAYDHNESRGAEFRYDGYEVNLRAGLRLPFQFRVTADYGYTRREYDEKSFFDPSRKRDDDVHRVSIQVARPLTEALELTLYGFYRNNGSNVAVYDYDRAIVGTYLSYRF